MPSGEWSFIHEWTLYEYMINRYNEGNLRLKWVVNQGKLNLKPQYVYIKYLLNISNTDFPDVKKIRFNGENYDRVAEVKFLTSKFKYHISNNKLGKYTYKDFLNDKGCIIVLGHDELPKKLEEKIDVFEIEQEDFLSYIRENMVRLINRQMHKSAYNKIWIMYQGPNFIKGTNEVLPAKESGRWCPSNNLNGFDLGVGDTVLFIKTNGARRQELNEKYSLWKIESVYEAKVSLSITSREHYYQIKNMTNNSLLWYDETEEGKRDPKIRKRKFREGFRWNRVFEFRLNNEYNNLDILISEMPNELKNFKEICKDVYGSGNAREITMEEYLQLFQYIAKVYTNN